LQSDYGRLQLRQREPKDRSVILVTALLRKLFEKALRCLLPGTSLSK